MKTKLFLFIPVILILLLINACNPIYHYFPSYQSIPNYREKNELQIDGALGNIYNIEFLNVGYETPFCLNSNIGYSISNRFFINTNISYNILGYGKNNYQISNLNYGFGLGYFNWYKGFNYGTKAGVSYGTMDIDFKDPNLGKKSFNANNFILSFCPFIAYKYNMILLSFQLNCSNYQYQDINNEFPGINFGGDLANFQKFQQIRNPFSVWFIEPSLSIKGGYKHLKIVIQKILSYHVGNTDLNYMKENFYLGLEFNFKLEEIFHRKPTKNKSL